MKISILLLLIIFCSPTFSQPSSQNKLINSEHWLSKQEDNFTETLNKSYTETEYPLCDISLPHGQKTYFLSKELNIS